jgi:hypothetical protein
MPGRERRWRALAGSCPAEMSRAARPVDRKRWRQSLVAHLEDFPRQLEALRFSTQTFGGDFDAAQFADAFESEEPELYIRVQAIERGFGRLQNYIALMAEDGTKLAGLPRRGFEANEPRAQPAFEALRDAGVITKDLCRRLITTQKSRSLFEHDYVRVAAEDVHAAVVKLLGVAPEFLERFSVWIEPYLLTRSPDQAAE